MRTFMPRAKTRLIRYSERMPLFSPLRPRAADRRASTSARCRLPSGGSIVIDVTEALTTVDVNSGKGTRGANQEENAWSRSTSRRRARWRASSACATSAASWSSTSSTCAARSAAARAREGAARRDEGRTAPAGRWAGSRRTGCSRSTGSASSRRSSCAPTASARRAAAPASSPAPSTSAESLLRRLETAAAAGQLWRASASASTPSSPTAFQNLHRQEIAALEREFEIRVEVIASTSLHRSEEKVEWFKRERPIAVEAAPVRAGDVSEDVTADVAAVPTKPARRKRKPRGKAAAEHAAPVGATPAEKPARRLLPRPRSRCVRRLPRPSRARSASGGGAAAASTARTRTRARRGAPTRRCSPISRRTCRSSPRRPTCSWSRETRTKVPRPEPAAAAAEASRSKRRRRRRRRRPAGEAGVAADDGAVFDEGPDSGEPPVAPGPAFDDDIPF